MIAAFDMDGTLVDSREAVTAAYRDVGINLPRDAWGKPWQEWLPAMVGPGTLAETAERAQALHSAKNARYRNHGHLLRPLPTLDVLRYYAAHRARVVVLTGASVEAAIHVLAKLRVSDLVVQLNCGMTLNEKARTLKVLTHTYGGTGIYFDDDLNAANILREDTDGQWTICHVVNR